MDRRAVDPGMPVTMKDKQRVIHRELTDGDEVKLIGEQTSTSTIIDQVGETLPILKDILRDVQGLTSGPVKQIADNANKLIERNSEVLERLLGRVDDIAATIQGITRSESEDIKIAIRNVKDITEGIKGLVGSAQGEVSGTGTELRNSLQKIQSSVDHLDKSLQNIEKITGKIADGEGTIGHLVNDDQIARNVENITEDTGRLLGGVARLQTIVGLRTEYNYLAKTFKNSFQVTLAPTPDKFYLIEIVDDPRGFREASTTVTNSSERGFVSETTVKTSEKLRISFQFGKRLGAIAGRFGIKESTGGVGTDVFLFDDRLTLSADLFDTRSNVRPRLTGRGSLAVYKRNVFLTGGVDDVMNYTRVPGLGGQFFDWFFGAHLVFNDEDLKSLLFFGGGAAAGASK
jgi:phospholipid/cholesterol/gamma-HCH transport system substrate-binding protein